jgi:AcrR family transcriptional regulator
MSPRAAVDEGRRRGRPPAANSAETKERILRVARERFAHLGYAATTNKDIASAADITTGAIYHYFGSKRDLYLAVFEEVERQVFERFDGAAAGGGTFVDRLTRVLHEAVAINREDGSIAAFFVAVPLDSVRNAELAGMATEQARDAREFFHRLVLDGVAAGEIPTDVPPQHVTNMVMALTAGLARFSTLIGDPDVHGQTTQVFERLLRGDLFPAPRRARRPSPKPTPTPAASPASPRSPRAVATRR